jgi:tetrathionate reductase subunit B
VNIKDMLITMQEDLAYSLEKKPEVRRWGMLIDTRKCVGCHACTIGCATEYKLPPGMLYRHVSDIESGKFPEVKRFFFSKACFQCAKPSCVPVCPAGATKKEEDGVVTIDYDKCIGCQACMRNCPYGARSFDQGAHHVEGNFTIAEYEKINFSEYGLSWNRSNPESPVIGSVRKCHFCVSLIREGRLPVCVSSCIGRAIYFGDLNNTSSLLVKTINENIVYRIYEKTGNEPQVYYVR